MRKILNFLKSLFQQKPKEGREIPMPEPIIEKDKTGLLWYPKAVVPTRKMPTKGRYLGGYPEGAVVHFTAGRDSNEQDAINSYNWGCDEGYTFFVIGPTGVVYQGFPLSNWGSHAGISKWQGLGSGVSNKLVGIEVVCAGKLDASNRSWFGVKYEDSGIRVISGPEHECEPGRYKKFTEAQETALIDLLKWLYKNNPEEFSTDLVLGHHEVSGMKGLGYWRKNDPGGSLSIPMSKLREKLKS